MRNRSHDFTKFTGLCHAINTQTLTKFQKSFIARKSIQIRLIFSKKSISQVKGLCQNRQLEKCQRSLKMAKIGTLSLVSRLTRGITSKLLMFPVRTCYHEDFIKNIDNSLKYALKNPKITNFCVLTVKKRSCDSFLGQLEP